MTHRVLKSISIASVVVLLMTALLFAQQRGQGGRGDAATPAPHHDPHDLSGIWLGRVVTSGLNDPAPVYTAAGKAAFDMNKPSFGPRAVAPALGNDPLGGANPVGIPRALINHATKIQFIQLPDKMVQLVEWNRFWREIFTDGHPLPEDPDLAWYGYSVGKWEGDEFVVTTSGLDPRAWADGVGTPKSEAAVVEERYHRLDHDNLQVTITVTDPKFYSKPAGGKFVFRLQPDTPTGRFIEDIFAPIDEESFNKRIRNPAGTGGTTAK